MRRARGQAGFTLIETLVAMLLAGVILGATLQALEVFQSQNRYDILRNEASDNVRNTLDSMSRQLLNAIAPETSSAATLEEAQPYSIMFRTVYSVTPSEDMRVRYFLVGTTPSNESICYQYKRFASGTTPAAAAAPGSECPKASATGGEWEYSAKLLNNVANKNKEKSRMLFKYGPEGATTTGNITSVQPRIWLEINPNKVPHETKQFTTIALRNANRAPVATCRAEEINGHVLIDASGSEDPDGLALKYRWWQNGLEMATTAQRFETEKFASGTSLEYKVEVIDPGNLKATAICTVKIK